MEAFLETLKVKEDYENMKEKTKQKVRDLELDKQKVLSGKTSLTAMIKSQTKEETIRQLEI